MEKEGISVGVAQRDGGQRKVGFAKSGPEIEGHRRGVEGCQVVRSESDCRIGGNGLAWADEASHQSTSRLKRE